MNDKFPVKRIPHDLSLVCAEVGKLLSSLGMYFSPGMRAIEALKARQRLEDTGYVGKRIVADDQEVALIVLNSTNTSMLLATVLAMLSIRAKHGVAEVDRIDKKINPLELYVQHMSFYNGSVVAEGTHHINVMAHLIQATEEISQVFDELNYDRLIQVYMGGVRPFVHVHDFALFEQRTGIKIEIIK